MESLGSITYLIFCFAIYFYFSYCLYIIALKTGHTDNLILAWIPILNIILLIQIAGKPIWWFLLLLIPLVNIVIYAIIWMKVCEARGKPSWLGILFIIPVIFIIMPAVIATD